MLSSVEPLPGILFAVVVFGERLERLRRHAGCRWRHLRAGSQDDTGNSLYRAAVGLAVAAAFVLVWINLAVGIIGSEDNPAKLMYGGVLAGGIIGGVIARFQPVGMARALSATALAQAWVGVIALTAGFGSTTPSFPEAVVFLTGFFAALWLISAWLFRKAAWE